MSISSYLHSLSSELIITDGERTLIDGYISALDTRVARYFEKNLVAEDFPFGSFTRKTLMPRKADSKSDVDYMVVFNPTKETKNTLGNTVYTYYEPATYLNWIRDFAENQYSRSEIFQSHPTIVLKLSDFKIEIVPAKKDAYDKYEIPAPASSYTRWLITTPNDFNAKVRTKNTLENSKIRPLIRVMKYWNAMNGYVYSSYELEQKIINCFYFNCTTVWDYINTFVTSLGVFGLGNGATYKINRLKQICDTAYKYENTKFPIVGTSGEAEIKKAFPEFKR